MTKVESYGIINFDYDKNGSLYPFLWKGIFVLMHSEPPLSDGTVGRSQRTAWCALLILSVVCFMLGFEHEKSHAGFDFKKGRKESYACEKASVGYRFTPYPVRC